MRVSELNSEDETKIYRILIKITIAKDTWESCIPMVGGFLNHISDKIRAKALWQLGEMGLLYPNRVEPFITQIVSMLHDKNGLIRQRAVCALGRIGRGRVELVAPHLDEIMNTANDSASEVRMNLIWAAENIATNAPAIFERSMDLFSRFLDDESIRVRIEAPEIFRVIGKRKPNYVLRYLDKLKYMSEHDEDRVVRAHSNGAVKATLSQIGR